MEWKKYLIPPVAIYAAIFIFISALIGFGLDQTALWVWLVALVITVVGLKVATKYVQPADARAGLTYGLVWLAVFVVLDLVLTVPFTGWEYFGDWKSYVPYVLTVLIPTLLSQKG